MLVFPTLPPCFLIYRAIIVCPWGEKGADFSDADGHLHHVGAFPPARQDEAGSASLPAQPYLRADPGRPALSRCHANSTCRVIDTLGAGDTFVAAFMYCFAHGLSLQEATEFACRWVQRLAVWICEVAWPSGRGIHGPGHWTWCLPVVPIPNPSLNFISQPGWLGPSAAWLGLMGWLTSSWAAPVKPAPSPARRHLLVQHLPTEIHSFHIVLGQVRPALLRNQAHLEVAWK